MIITKANMKEILTKILRSQQYRLATPASNGKKIDFLEITDISEMIMDNRTTYKSPKAFFFPRCEKLFSFHEEGIVISELEKPIIVFGVRPCDLEALDVMTRIFTQGKFNDPFFASHREHNLMIGIGCQEKNQGCFCEHLSIDMNYSNKCDLFLENFEDSYRICYVSDKGQEKLSPFIPELTTFENSKGQDTSFPSFSPPTSTGIKMRPVETWPYTTAYFDRIEWETITEICQGCGLCTFVCPTCHCFDFRDIEQKGTASRYRIWDSCMYPQFTLHASGHNPRNSKTERYRQRILHKYVYTPKNVGMAACTGCGRCIRSCPAGMDIRQVIKSVMEVTI